jgi:hypothetical protein
MALKPKLHCKPHPLPLPHSCSYSYSLNFQRQLTRAHLGTTHQSTHGAGYYECSIVGFAHFLFLALALTQRQLIISVNPPHTPASSPVCPPMEWDAPSVSIVGFADHLTHAPTQ